MPGPSYSTVGSNNLSEAMIFYDAVLPLVGMSPKFNRPSGGRLYAAANGTIFAVLAPYDHKTALPGNGAMVGFAMESREQVDAFHAKVLESGGINEGDPGERAPGYYFAYCRDLDGNKLCAYNWG